VFVTEEENHTPDFVGPGLDATHVDHVAPTERPDIHVVVVGEGGGIDTLSFSSLCGYCALTQPQ